jgi:hypothetical protein
LLPVAVEQEEEVEAPADWNQGFSVQEELVHMLEGHPKEEEGHYKGSSHQLLAPSALRRSKAGPVGAGAGRSYQA